MLCMEVIQVSTRGRIETVQGGASAVKREYLMYLDMRACVPDFHQGCYYIDLQYPRYFLLHLRYR